MCLCVCVCVPECTSSTRVDPRHHSIVRHVVHPNTSRLMSCQGLCAVCMVELVFRLLHLLQLHSEQKVKRADVFMMTILHISTEAVDQSQSKCTNVDGFQVFGANNQRWPYPRPARLPVSTMQHIKRVGTLRARRLLENRLLWPFTVRPLSNGKLTNLAADPFKTATSTKSRRLQT